MLNFATLEIDRSGAVPTFLPLFTAASEPGVPAETATDPIDPDSDPYLGQETYSHWL